MAPIKSNRNAEPFRIHAAENSNGMARHVSMDNLSSRPIVVGRHSPERGSSKQQGMRYNSMMNLNIGTPLVQTKQGSRHNRTPSNAIKTVSKSRLDSSQKQPKEHDNNRPPSKPDRRQKISINPPLPVKTNNLPKSSVNNSRDAKLHHLGRMTPEEQLDKFLQSVEEVNAENELMLNQEMEVYEHKAVKAPQERAYNKNSNLKNLRKDSSVANRWHSMDNLNAAKKANNANKARPVDKKNNPRKKTPMDPPVAKSSKSYRDISGPKSFSSMTQLDHLPPAHQKPKFLSSKSPSPNRFSPMDISSSQSRTSSSTEDANAGNKKIKNKKERHISPRHLISSHAHRTKVSYLGCLPLNNQGSDLSSLQLPLKELYFSYIEKKNTTDTLIKPSSLEITDTGIKVNYVREKQKGVSEIFNPFPTIAVWAAVRFIYKRETDQDGKTRFSFAFLPLISDPGDAERNQLFNPLIKKDWKLAAQVEHPAMFACIMRRNGVPKQLECHGFVCDSKDDAIDIASNLYKSLMETMKKQNNNHDNDNDSVQHSYQNDIANSYQNPDPPSRPPRSARNKGHHRKHKRSSSEQQSSDNNNENSVMVRRHSEKRPLDNDNDDDYYEDEDALITSTQRRIKRSISERRSMDDSDVNLERRRGDIYTKVAMPRSKSFMNVSGPYNLQELFKELREKEGIESVDDILRQVINPDGMSFNKISPMYKELLMKLAMSMSGDEMFIRSRNIMMQEKEKKSGHGHSTFFKILQLLGMSKKNKNVGMDNRINNKNKLSKTDISNPSPVSQETKRELTNLWMKTSPQSFLQAGDDENDHINLARMSSQNEDKKNIKRNRHYCNDTDRDSYMSCSECGYQSICGTSCSCSLVISTHGAIKENDVARMSTSSDNANSKK